MDQMAATSDRDYDRVERAIRYIAANRLEQPSLDEVADAMGLSPFHAQRVFSRWAGLSPKRFLGLLTVEHAKSLLRSSESVLGAAFEVGLSGGSRLHDLFLSFEAITPANTSPRVPSCSFAGVCTRRRSGRPCWLPAIEAFPVSHSWTAAGSSGRWPRPRPTGR